jgi:hypothetical protein
MYTFMGFKIASGVGRFKGKNWAILEVRRRRD